MISFASAVLLALLALLQQLELPAYRGFVNDFAGVVAPDRQARIEAIATEVKQKSGGEIAVVVLPDLKGNAPGEVALRIGREWKVGAAAQIGDRTRNAGAVILLSPRETNSAGRGQVFISTGQGTEGFLTDAETGAIQDEALPALRQGDYGAALELMARRVAEHYGREFGFTLSADPGAGVGAQPPPQYERRPVRRSSGINPILIIILVFVVLSLLGGRRGRGRGGCGGGGCIPIPIFFPGGGFGGFGGGGGFSGGGSGRDF
jgi:uncharacterized protein